jgi:uncharacterized protein
MKRLIASVFFLLVLLPVNSEPEKTLHDHHAPSEIIRVQGVAEKEIQADKAEITFIVESKQKSIDKASEELSRISSKLMSALKEENLDHKNIEMLHFSIREITKYDKDQSKSVFDYYHAQKKYRLNIFKDTLNDEDFYKKVSKLVKTLSLSGINQIENLNYLLSRLEEEKDLLLKEALNNAKRRASVMIEDQDVKLGELVLITEGTLQTGLSPFGREEIFLSQARAASYSSTDSVENTIRLKATVDAAWRLCPTGDSK